MKIVYVSDAVYPYNKGGKEKRLYEISTRLAAMGHDVHIYTMHWWKGHEKERIENGVHLHAICRLHPLYSGNRRSIKEGIMFGLACFRLFKVPFDILDVDQMPFFPVLTSWVVCKIRGRKMHATWYEALTTADWVSYMGKGGYIASFIERLCIRLPYAISVSSQHTIRLLASYHRRITRISLVPPGIDETAMQLVEPVRFACDVLYAGRLVKDKNVDVLLDAFAVVAERDKSAHCIIIGHGVEKKKLQEQARSLGLVDQVTFLKPLPESSDVFAYMKKAKVFVLPSVREGFGMVALEALACGTPVITVNSPANASRDLIDEDRTGSIVPLDKDAIAQSILAWLHTPATEIDVREYDWNVLAAKQAEVYSHV